MNSKFLISFRDGSQEEYEAKDWKFLLISIPIYFGAEMENIERIEICKLGDCTELKNKNETF